MGAEECHNNVGDRILFELMSSFKQLQLILEIKSVSGLEFESSGSPAQHFVDTFVSNRSEFGLLHFSCLLYRVEDPTACGCNPGIGESFRAHCELALSGASEDCMCMWIDESWNEDHPADIDNITIGTRIDLADMSYNAVLDIHIDAVENPDIAHFRAALELLASGRTGYDALRILEKKLHGAVAVYVTVMDAETDMLDGLTETADASAAT